MRRLGIILGIVLLAGCARFEPRPLAPAEMAARLERRTLTNDSVRVFLQENLKRDFSTWPPAAWDFEMLTLAALHYSPSLEVARAQWAVAGGGEVTAAQRPNPVLTVTPAYNATTLAPSPWLPLGYLDVPIETAGKRKYRRAQAAQLAEAARLNIATVAWQVRSDLRASLLDLTAADQRKTLLEAQTALQEEIVRVLEQQAQAGAIASSEMTTVRIALAKARLDLADARRQRAEAGARVATALGVPTQALEEIKIAFDLQRDPAAAASLTSAEVRRLALLSRSDILAGLAEYSASQSALQLEIAKQYPDIHLQPGYEFDQGDSKWSLGLSVELPVLHQNQGPIAEAKARREESAARFNALQAKVLGELDRTVATFHATEQTSASFEALAAAQAKRSASVEAHFNAGAVERLDLLNAKLEAAAAELVQLDGRLKLAQASGSLEDAVQRPLTLPPAIFQSSRTNGR